MKPVKTSESVQRVIDAIYGQLVSEDELYYRLKAHNQQDKLSIAGILMYLLNEGAIKHVKGKYQLVGGQS